ncbi:MULTISPECIES: DUF6080 domain-containing protein [unclassified Dysgonomonas]|uniref:DUF6080 domain-containing protein n=1 Tax=unclassified Dysgonomonas TaxID=2630389 RepID=UPI001C87CE7E|nr:MULTISPECIES: DUF6080 domain-containing protein [unclassified Dysgonomonas]
MDSKTKVLKDNFVQLKNVVITILPKGKIEISLFLFFTFIYLSYSLFLLFHTYILDYPYAGIYDLYLSFDNTPIFNQGFLNLERHPLMLYFTKPLMLVGDVLIKLFGYKAKGVFIVLFCTSIVSLSIVYIYRYLKIIVGVNKYPLYLLVFFYGFFSTNLILCFTIESFTISLFLLTFTVYYYSYCILSEKKVTFLSNIFFAFALGGTTITNFAKGIIPIFFIKGNIKNKLYKIFALGILFFLSLVWIEFRYNIFSNLTSGINKFIYSESSLLEKVVDLFLGSPIFFPPIQKGLNEYSGVMIETDRYHFWWQYLFVGLLFFFIIYSIIRGYKNKYIQLLVLFFSCDIFLHVILKFGIAEGFLYGGHWVYVVPLFLGWLYKSLSKKTGNIFLLLLSCMFLFLCVNNIYQLINFLTLAIEYYPLVLPDWISI